MGRSTQRSDAVSSFRPTGPEAGHQPARSRVADLEALDYVVDALGRDGMGQHLALMAHPDGSAASVVVGGSLGRMKVVVAVRSCLLLDRQWVVTCPDIATGLTPHFWADGVDGSPSVAEVVEHHRATRAWLATEGVRVFAIGLGRCIDDLDARTRASAATRRSPGWEGSVELRRDQPLALVAGVGERLQSLREAQAEVVSAVPLMPDRRSVR